MMFNDINFPMHTHTFLAKFNNMDELAQAALAIIILIPSIYWCMVVIFKKLKKEKIPLPPGPYGLPIVGYLPFLGSNLHTEFAELARQYGPIFKLHLGSKLCVVLSSPSLVKEVAREQDIVFANRYPTVAAMVFSYGGFDIGWAPYGSYWRSMRKVLVREMLNGRNLDNSYDLRRTEVRKAIDCISTNVGTAIKIGELTFQTELNLVLNMLWGRTLEVSQKSKVGAEFRVVFQKILELLGKPNISDFFPILGCLDIQGVEKEAKACLKIAEEIVDAVMTKRVKVLDDEEENAARKKDFIQILLEIEKLEDTGEVISMTQKKGILMDILVGGTDSTTATTEWAMTELLHHREAMEKVRKELDEVVGQDNAVEEFHLSKLRYLEAVVKEAMRLHPTVPLLLPKCPSQTSNVAGYTIPKDTKVFVNAWAIQRDPEVWDNPLEFKPERFLTEHKKWDYSGNSFQYIPFGTGRRICPGIPLAERMLMYMLASLVHSFDWEPTASKEVDRSEKFGVVMRKSTPLSAIPTKRTHKY